MRWQKKQQVSKSALRSICAFYMVCIAAFEVNLVEQESLTNSVKCKCNNIDIDFKLMKYINRDIATSQMGFEAR